MDRVVILGAGELGGLIAHALARRAVAHDVCLLDEKARVAEGKALDIMQAAPLEGFSTTVVGSSDVSIAGGATVVVMADAFGGDEWQGDTALGWMRRLREFSPKSKCSTRCSGGPSASSAASSLLTTRRDVEHAQPRCLYG